MSCTFWLRRKRTAALKEQKKQEDIYANEGEIVENTKEITKETPKKTPKKTPKERGINYGSIL